MKQKLFFSNKSLMLSVMAFSFVLLFFTEQSIAQTISDGQGYNNGFFYSYWNQGAGTTTYTGTPTVTLGAAGNYSTSWSNVNNFTAGKGWKPGSPNRIINFTGSFNGGSNGYLAIYGWTTNPLIEYYVVENYGNWTPPGGTSLGTFTSDDGTYNIFQMTRTNQPSITGTATFQQYWSVRTTKRSTGTVTFANHVAAWAAKGMNMGTTWDYQIMETEGYHSTGSSNITMSEGKLNDVPSTEAVDLDVYPNPVTDKFIFTLPMSKSEVSVLSIDGSQVMCMNSENQEITIDMTKYNAGVYLLRIVSEGQSITKKIIKK